MKWRGLICVVWFIGPLDGMQPEKVISNKGRSIFLYAESIINLMSKILSLQRKITLFPPEDDADSDVVADILKVLRFYVSIDKDAFELKEKFAHKLLNWFDPIVIKATEGNDILTCKDIITLAMYRIFLDHQEQKDECERIQQVIDAEIETLSAVVTVIVQLKESCQAFLQGKRKQAHILYQNADKLMQQALCNQNLSCDSKNNELWKEWCQFFLLLREADQKMIETSIVMRLISHSAKAYYRCAHLASYNTVSAPLEFFIKKLLLLKPNDSGFLYNYYVAYAEFYQGRAKCVTDPAVIRTCYTRVIEAYEKAQDCLQSEMCIAQEELLHAIGSKKEELEANLMSLTDLLHHTWYGIGRYAVPLGDFEKALNAFVQADFEESKLFIAYIKWLQNNHQEAESLVRELYEFCKKEKRETSCLYTDISVLYAAVLYKKGMFIQGTRLLEQVDKDKIGSIIPDLIKIMQELNNIKEIDLFFEELVTNIAHNFKDKKQWLLNFKDENKDLIAETKGDFRAKGIIGLLHMDTDPIRSLTLLKDAVFSEERHAVANNKINIIFLKNYCQLLLHNQHKNNYYHDVEKLLSQRIAEYEGHPSVGSLKQLLGVVLAASGKFKKAELVQVGSLVEHEDQLVLFDAQAQAYMKLHRGELDSQILSFFDFNTKNLSDYQYIWSFKPLSAWAYARHVVRQGNKIEYSAILNKLIRQKQDFVVRHKASLEKAYCLLEEGNIGQAIDVCTKVYQEVNHNAHIHTKLAAQILRATIRYNYQEELNDEYDSIRQMIDDDLNAVIKNARDNKRSTSVLIDAYRLAVAHACQPLEQRLEQLRYLSKQTHHTLAKIEGAFLLGQEYYWQQNYNKAEKYLLWVAQQYRYPQKDQAMALLENIYQEQYIVPYYTKKNMLYTLAFKDNLT